MKLDLGELGDFLEDLLYVIMDALFTIHSFVSLGADELGEGTVVVIIGRCINS